jgi:hypothetical protein
MQQYFAGERSEMTIILCGCALALLTVLTLYFVQRDGFSKGLLLTVALGTLIFGSASITILKRDPPKLQGLVAHAESGASELAAQSEAQRISTVISSYKYYRLAAASFTVVAVLLSLLIRVGFWNGVATGLIIMAAAQMTIDHYSEIRAHRYLSDLTARPVA